jgi:protein-disulfide isomerase
MVANSLSHLSTTLSHSTLRLCQQLKQQNVSEKLVVAKKYFAFIESVFAKGTPTQAVMDEVSKKSVSMLQLSKHVSMLVQFKSRVDAHMAEGSSKFGVNGTPGNVLINTKTGKYEVVSGAQPEANFDAAITRLMAE